jgi:hypothetical protein
MGNSVGRSPNAMPALGIQMHLHRDPNLLQSNVVSQRVVHVVIFRLQQKRRRRLAGDRNIDSTQDLYRHSPDDGPPTFWCLA